MWGSRYWLIGFLVTAAGCGSAHKPVSAPAPKTSAAAGQQSAEGSLPVQIDNQNFSAMDVYLVNGSQRWLLGQAGGLTETTLTVPSSLSPADGRLRLLAEPVGSRQPIVTPVLVVGPGQTVYWTIGSDPQMSTASVG